MTPREKLQYCYELAFYPPRLNAVWHRIKNGEAEAKGELDELREHLDTALSLHLALPETGYASQRALTRLALYQANARAFGMVRFLKNIRKHLGCSPLKETAVPRHLVRDIGLPKLTHH